MRVAIIGRSEMLLDTARHLRQLAHEIAVVVTAREAPEYATTTEDFRAFAAECAAPFLQSARMDEVASMLAAQGPLDVGVSVNYTAVISQRVIDMARLGILNAHGGDLPRYRGNACQAWAILNGEERIGLCVHRMDGGTLDSGDIVEREYFPLAIDTKITAVHAWMRDRVPPLFASALRHLEADPSYALEHQSRDPVDAVRCYPRRPEDGRIDWRRSAREILRLINASNRPYGGAYCEFCGRRVVVWDAELAPPERFLAVPGQVTCIGDGFVEVATGDGKLRVMLVESVDGLMTPDRLVRSIRERFC